MAQPSCAYCGAIPLDGTFVAGSFVQNATPVAAGSHKVRSFLYTGYGADCSIYEIQYQIHRY